MAERIDIIVSAKGGASPGSTTPGQSLPGMPSPKPMPDPTPQARKGIDDLAQGVLNLQAAFTGLAVVQVGQQLIGLGVSAGQAYLQLEKVENTARLLSGTTANYNALVNLARENQKLFGGTLAENIQGLSGFANTARKSGIELATFNDLSQRLNLLSPEQGMEGAAIALKEALSGDTQSLVERFELPRAALAKLKAEGLSAADRVKILNDVLTDQGVAAGAAASQVSDTAKAYNEFGAAADLAKTKAGEFLAVMFSPAARGGARVLSGDFAAAGQSLSDTFELAGTGVQRLVGLSGGWGAAANSARDYATQIGIIKPMQQEIGEWGGVGGGGGDWSTGAKDAGAASAELSNQLDISKIAAQAQEQALSSAAQAAYKARDAGGGLSAQARAAAQALLANGNAGAAAAAQLARSSSQIDIMTAALYRQAVAAREAAGGKSGANVNATQQKKRDWQAAQDLAAAQARYTEATESSAQRVARLRSELGGLTKGTAAYVDKQTQLAQAEKQLAAERTRAGTSAEKASDRVAAAQEQEVEAARDAAQRVESIQRDHLDRMRRMAEDYALSQSRAQEDYEDRRRRLLAEGKRAEAGQLAADYAKERRRAAEDAARARQRESEQAGQQIAETQGKAAQDAADRATKRAQQGIALPGAQAPAAPAAAVSPPPAAPSAAQAQSALAATAGQQPRALTLQIQTQIAPTAVQVGPEQIVTVTWPLFEQRLIADLTTGAITAPPQPQPGGVGGARP